MKNNLVNQDIKTDKPVPMTYEALKADRDAQQKRADALAVRNEQLMAFVTEGFNIAGQGGSWCGGDIQELGEKLGLFARETYQPVLHGYVCGHEPGEDSVYVITPATSAAIADIEARGVEKFLDSEHCSQESHGCVCRYLDELQEAK